MVRRKGGGRSFGVVCAECSLFCCCEESCLTFHWNERVLQLS